MIDDKMHAVRSVPTAHHAAARRAQFGGQRFGDEAWALEGFGANILQVILTIKSDDVMAAPHEAIVKGENLPKPYSEAMNVLHEPALSVKLE